MKLRCDCGGELRTAKLKNFDFTPFAGFPITLHGIPGLRCTKCRKETMTGTVLNLTLNVIGYEITRLPFRLNADLATYLRKRLGVTQALLAEKMGIDRTTVADWERGAALISPQHDFILRAMLITSYVLQPTCSL